MHYIGKSYETTVYKFDDEKIIDRFLGQIFSDDSEKKAWQVYTNAFHREKLCKHCIQVWRWKKIWSLWKKSVTSVYNALYREKLWNHCIQVWRWKNNWPLLGTNIFWWSTKKKRDKCIQMHYIGKSYVNTVYKCDDGKKSDHSEKKVWQVYTMHYIGKSYVTTVYKCDDEKKSDHSEKKSVTSVYNALYREKLWNHCIQVWRWKKKLTASWDKYFLMILKKKAWQVYTNALHREKLCNHCIQVWQQTETSCHKRIYGTNIFWWSTKKAWQVYTMHYIGKSYVTTV